MKRKYIKYLLFILGGVLVILVAVIVIVLATFDPNAYKPRIVQMVKERTGRTLTIDGDIGLAFFPKIGADLPPTRLSGRNSAEEFAGVNRLRIYVALFPLLRKRLVIDEVRLEGLRANLVKFKDGTTNFSDLLSVGKKPSTEPERRPSQPPGAPLAFDVGGIHVVKSHLGWKDEKTGRDLSIEVNDLKTGRLTDKQPAPLTMDVALKGAQPKLDLKIKSKGMLTFDLAQQAYSCRDFTVDLTGSAMEFSAIAAALRGDVEAHGAKPLIKVSRLNLEAKAERGNDRLNVKVSAPAVQTGGDAVTIEGLSATASGTAGTLNLSSLDLKAPKLVLNPSGRQVLVDGLALQAKGKMGSDDLDVTFSAPKLDVSPERASGDPAELIAHLRGAERKAAFALKLSALEGSAKALKISALQLSIDASQKDTGLKGTLTTPITGNLEGKLFEMPKILADFTITGSQIPQKTVRIPLSGSMRADFAQERIFADLLAKVDESTLKAKVGMSRFHMPAYNFDVDMDKLNLDRYVPPKKEGTGKEKPASGGPPNAPPAKTTEQPIDFSPLKPLDVDGKLRLGSLQVRNMKFSNFRADVRARNGRLNVDPLSADLYQGTTRGDLSVDANANRVAVKQNLTGVAIGPLLRDAANKDMLEGKGNVFLDVSTTGNLVSSMKRALNGTARMALRDGAVKGIDLAATVRQVKAKFGRQDAEGAGSKTEKTDFTEMNASFLIKNGVAHNDDLSLKSPLLRATGAGDIHIGEDSLDYVVNVAFVGTMAGQGGKELSDLKGFAIPVRLSGPYAALKYKVEFSQMFSSKEQIEAGKEILRESAKGKLGELGGSLLGGKEQPPKGGEKGQSPAPTRKPEDEIKDRLKGLLR